MRPILLLGLFSLLIAGCSGASAASSDGSAVPATGAILIDGQPLAGGMVTFVPASGTGGNGASGATDASGRYELASLDADGTPLPGVLPGKYKVIVSRLTKPDGTPFVPSAEASPMSVNATESLPVRFTSPSATPLLADVPATGAKSLDFQITSK